MHEGYCMILIVLLFIVIIVKLLKQRNSQAFAFKTFSLAALLALVTILLFELLNGPHPECGIDESVGPCDYIGRVKLDLALILFPTIIFWLIILLIDVFIRKIVKRRTISK